MLHSDVQSARQGAQLLGWAGERVVRVAFRGVAFTAVASLDPTEHGRRCLRGDGAVLEAERLAIELQAGPSRTLAPPLRLHGCLVVARDANGVREAALLAGYAPRAVMLQDQRSLLGLLADAAVLDVGIVLVASHGPRLLSLAGPRVPGGHP